MHRFVFLIFFWLLTSWSYAQDKSQDARTIDDLYYDGKDLYAEGRYEDALEKYQAAFVLARKIWDEPVIRLQKLHRRIGKTYQKMYFLKAAEAHFDTASILAEELYGQLNDETIWSYMDQAVLQSKQFNIKKSGALNKKALDKATELNGENSQQVIGIMMHIGINEYKLESFDEAERIMLEAIKKARNKYLPDDEAFNRLYNNIGMVYRKKRDYNKALQFAKSALQIKLKRYRPDHPSVVKYYSNIGRIYLDMEEVDSCHHYFNKMHQAAWANREKVPNLYGSTFNDMGRGYSMSGDFEKASEYFRKARDEDARKYRPEHPYAIADAFNLALCYEQMGDYEEAANTLKEYSAQWTDNNDHFLFTCPVGMEMARYYRKTGDFDKSRSICDSLLQVFSQLEKNNPQWKNVSSNAPNLARLYRERALTAWQSSPTDASALSSAHKDLERAMHEAENSWQKNYSEEARSFLSEESEYIYESAIKLAFEMGQTNEVIKLMERNRANILKMALQNRDNMSTDKLPDSLLAELNQLRNEVYDRELKWMDANDSYNKDLARENLLKANQNHDRFMTDLSQSFPSYYALRFETDNSLDVAELQDFCGQDQATVSYYLASDFSLGVVILKDTLISFEFQLSDNEIGWIEGLQKKQTLQNTSIESEQLNLEICSKIWSPVETILLDHHISRVTIAPHDALSYLPFDMLMRKKGEEHKYLLEDYAFSYTSSLAFLLKKEKQKKSYASDYVGFAPTYNKVDEENQLMAFRSDLLPLPMAKDEVMNGQNIFKGKSFLGRDATKKRFLETANDAKILHLAMHAKMEGDDAYNNGLYFFQKEKVDHISENKLTLLDLYNMDLPSDMVILSACQTGAGKIRGNEGPLSLSRGFQYAGAKSIVMNQWLASDAASTAIVSSFLKNIHDGQPKDVALQQAKINYLKNADQLTAHPYFWAGMNLYGSTSALSNPMSYGWVWALGSLMLIILFYAVYSRRYTG